MKPFNPAAWHIVDLNLLDPDNQATCAACGAPMKPDRGTRHPWCIDWSSATPEVHAIGFVVGEPGARQPADAELVRKARELVASLAARSALERRETLEQRMVRLIEEGKPEEARAELHRAHPRLCEIRIQIPR